MADKKNKIKWYSSISFLGLLGLTLIPLWDMAGISFVMSTEGKNLVVAESSRLIEQLGNNAISEIGQRSRQIEALARSIATLGERLPKDESLFKNVLPHIIDFDQDLLVAGGGIWPEPNAFVPGVDKRSFFYGRDDKGKLAYFDDYNHGRGYHHDEWYPVVKYSKPGECFWSKSYMDPYSYQPMVTCTVAMRQNDKFVGVSTIDLKLEGMHEFIEQIRLKTGGYVFLLDRNNKFLTFPKPEMVKLVEQDDKGNRTEEFLLVKQLADKEKLFAPIAEAVAQMNQKIVNDAKKMKSYDSSLVDRITSDSDQITKEEAEFIAAVIADPLQEHSKQTNLYTKFEIDNDFLIHESSLVFIFNVPESYWKLVIVKPIAEAQAVASAINRTILTLISITILVGIVLAALLMHFFFTKPMKATTAAVEVVGELVAAKDFKRLNDHKIPKFRNDELGSLSDVINSLASELQNSYGAILDLNANLEQKVEERTEELQTRLEQIRQLKFQQDGDYYLTSLLIKPLGGVQTASDFVTIQELMVQNKQFEFKQWKEEIGGDICIARNIQLRGKPCTVFVNADAMGKSIQGAGGVLVLGAIFQANIERTKYSSTIQFQSPEQWLKYAFLEMQTVFESFSGYMLISCVFGLIEDATGSLYCINAEHPGTVLLRNGKAGFLETGAPLRKIGFLDVRDRLRIDVYPLKPGDILLIGSDGRDDILIGHTADGERIINEDENLFVQDVQETNADLQEILKRIEKRGQITDDLSLLRIAYREGESGDTLSAEGRNLIGQARELYVAKNYEEMLDCLDKANAAAPGYGGVIRGYARAHYKLKNYEKAASYATQYIEENPWDSDFLEAAAIMYQRAGKQSDAIDTAERLRLRRPKDIDNLKLLIQLHTQTGNLERTTSLKREIEDATVP